MDRGEAVLRAAEDALRLEQAVRGIEALNEVELHDLLARGLALPVGGAGSAWGVLREVAYPTPPARRALRRERPRCDIVLTACEGDVLEDLVVRAKEADALAETLFADVLQGGVTGECTRNTDGASGTKRAARGIPPDEAMWIEVKTLGQFAYRDGVPGPNMTYTSELCRGLLSDAQKLGSDPRIAHAAALCVLFAVSDEVARHDLEMAVHGLLDRGAPVGSFEMRSFPIPDRIGNRVCALAGVGIVSGLVSG